MQCEFLHQPIPTTKATPPFEKGRLGGIKLGNHPAKKTTNKTPLTPPTETATSPAPQIPS
jgi:hypothetical protein